MQKLTQEGDNKCSFKRELECDEWYYEENCEGISTGEATSMEVQCNYDKSWTWTDKEPKMKLRQCEEAPEIENGRVDSMGTFIFRFWLSNSTLQRLEAMTIGPVSLLVFSMIGHGEIAE